MDVIFNRQTIISFPDNDLLPDITPTSEHGRIADGSLYLDEVLFTDRFTVGECNANMFECELYDYDTVGKGERIYVYQIVDEVEGEEPVEVPIFMGYVDECVVDRGRFEDSKKITAYDVLQWKGGENVAKWWAKLFDEAVQVTVKQIRDSLFEFMDIECDDVTLPNDDLYVTHTQKLNIISFSAVLNYIMIVNASNAKTDREGVVHFITVSDEEPIEIDEVYAQNTSEFDTYTIPAYAGVRITNSAKNIVVTAGADYNILDIVDNLLLLKYNKNKLANVAQAILNVVKNVTYKPAQLDMIYSQLDIKVGDKVSIGDNIYLVCENTLSGSLFVDQHIASTGASAFEDTSRTYDAGKAEMQSEISASSLKYYRYQNEKAVEIQEDQNVPIISIRYSISEPTIVTFQGAIIMDVDVIDETKPAIVQATYEVHNIQEETYKPTETYFYFDGDEQRHTLNLLHYWEHSTYNVDTFKVYLKCTNCTVTIGAYREEAIMSGLGLLGETVWNGWIDATDKITTGQFENEPHLVTPYTDTPTLQLKGIIRLTITEQMGCAEFTNEPSVVPFQGGPYFNQYPLHELTWGEVALFDWTENGIYDDDTEKYYAW